MAKSSEMVNQLGIVISEIMVDLDVHSTKVSDRELRNTLVKNIFNTLADTVQNDLRSYLMGE